MVAPEERAVEAGTLGRHDVGRAVADVEPAARPESVERLIQIVGVGFPPTEPLRTEVPPTDELEGIEFEPLHDEPDRRVVVVADQSDRRPIGEAIEGVDVVVESAGPVGDAVDDVRRAPFLAGRVERRGVDADRRARVYERVGVLVPRQRRPAVVVDIESPVGEEVFERTGMNHGVGAPTLQQYAVHVEQDRDPSVAGVSQSVGIVSTLPSIRSAPSHYPVFRHRDAIGFRSAAVAEQELISPETERIRETMSTTTEPHVTVDGDDAVRVPVPLPEDHGYETAAIEETFRCSTGAPIPGEWTGVSVGDLLLAADAPAETTHIKAEGADGFRVCVPIGAALDGVLTFGDGQTAEDPRFEALGISGTRTAKGVRRVTPLALDPGEYPERWEDFKLGEE